MHYRLLKDRRRRILSSIFEARRVILRSLVESLDLPDRLRGLAYRSLRSLPRDSSPTRVRNRCVLTGRSRSIVRRFGLSRLRFRSLALQGKLPGVHKARWLLLHMDTLSSRITVLRNAQQSGRPSVLLTPRQGGGTRLGRSVLRLLVREGYIDAFSVYSYSSCSQVASPSSVPLANQTTFLVHLKYGSHGQPAFNSIQRVSTPSRRVYLASSALWQPQTGLGLLVLSTPRGVLTDRDARQQGLGGEVLRAI